jgi:putative transposase
MRLTHKAELDDNKVVRVVGEPGTSKTCGNCGRCNDNLGGSKIFTCLKKWCKVVIDRDVNGARNNMLAAFITN